FSGQQRIVFPKVEPYSTDCIRRMAQNASIGKLKVHLTGSNNSHREVCNLIKELDIDVLDLSASYAGEQTLKEMMDDAFFLDLTRSCKSLFLCESKKITAQAFHQLCKNMAECSTKLRKLYVDLHGHSGYLCQQEFLKLIGITQLNHKYEMFFSKRDIEAYKFEKVPFSDSDMDSDFEFDDEFAEFLHEELESDDRVLVFDGSLQIDFSETSSDFLALEFHETRESLEKAKSAKGLVRMDNQNQKET
ncbi:hypothetical protein PENTCL1PPCAC_22573, partial [Pristionchus entomophagus]